MRDSAGIRIVDNPVTVDAGHAFRFTTGMSLRLGGLHGEPDREFRAPGAYLAAVRLSSGNIAIIDWDRVHLVSRDGIPLRIFGRRGRGPGEFQYLTGLCRLRGDTLVVWDDGGRRVGIFTGEGRLVRHIPLALESPSGGSCSSEGVILVTGIAANPDHPLGAGGTARLIRTDGTQVGPSLYFDPGSLDAVGREPTVAIVGNTVVMAEGLRWEIREHARGGALARLIRARDTPARISNREYDRLIETMVPNQRNAAAMRARLREQRTSTYWPAYGRMLVDPIGCIWVEERRPPGRPGSILTGRWFAFSRAGRLLGYLELPARGENGPTEVLRIDSNEAVLRYRDGDGAVWLDFRKVEPVAPGVAC